MQNIEYHNERLNRSRRELFGIIDSLNLSALLLLPEDLNNGIYKCRIVYSDIVHSIEFLPYIPKIVNTIKIINNDQIDYRYKYYERSCFKKLMKDIIEDDILIIKNGFVTDTSYSNIVFYDGTNWITPSTYLLNGTRRRYLLDTKKIISRNIKVEDIKNFESARLINAMLDFENGQQISIGNIVF